MTLTEFLTARLDEDEAYARHFTATDDSTPAAEYAYLAARRVLREVEAKRRIVELHRPVSEPAFCEHVQSMPPACQECGTGCDMDGLCVTLKVLAAVYADLPDYREAWRPEGMQA